MQILIACFQLLLPLLIERNLQGTLNAVSGNHTRKTHGNTTQTVFSVQHNRGGNDCTFISHNRPDQTADAQCDAGARVAFQFNDVQPADLHLCEQLLLVDRLRKFELTLKLVKRNTDNIDRVPRYKACPSMLAEHESGHIF